MSNWLRQSLLQIGWIRREPLVSADARCAARRPGGTRLRAVRRPAPAAVHGRVHEPRPPRRPHRAQAPVAALATAWPALARALLCDDGARPAVGEPDAHGARRY